MSQIFRIRNLISRGNLCNFPKAFHGTVKYVTFCKCCQLLRQIKMCNPDQFIKYQSERFVTTSVKTKKILLHKKRKMVKKKTSSKQELIKKNVVEVLDANQNSLSCDAYQHSSETTQSLFKCMPAESKLPNDTLQYEEEQTKWNEEYSSFYHQLAPHLSKVDPKPRPAESKLPIDMVQHEEEQRKWHDEYSSFYHQLETHSSKVHPKPRPAESKLPIDTVQHEEEQRKWHEEFTSFYHQLETPSSKVNPKPRPAESKLPNNTVQHEEEQRKWHDEYSSFYHQLAPHLSKVNPKPRPAESKLPIDMVQHEEEQRKWHEEFSSFYHQLETHSSKVHPKPRPAESKLPIDTVQHEEEQRKWHEEFTSFYHQLETPSSKVDPKPRPAESKLPIDTVQQEEEQRKWHEECLSFNDQLAPLFSKVDPKPIHLESKLPNDSVQQEKGQTNWPDECSSFFDQLHRSSPMTPVISGHPQPSDMVGLPQPSDMVGISEAQAPDQSLMPEKDRKSGLSRKRERKASKKASISKKVTNSKKASISKETKNLKTISKKYKLNGSYSNLFVIKNMCDISKKLGDIAPNATLEDEEKCLDVLDASKAVSGNADSKQSTRRRANKQFNESLVAFIDVCAFSGLLDAAQKTMEFYHLPAGSNTRSRGSRSSSHFVTSTDPYNILMHAWAKRGKLSPIEDLFSYMTQHDLKPTLQSFAAYFECLGRRKVFDDYKGQKILAKATEMGIQVKDMFQECNFSGDERYYIEKAIRTLLPDYSPSPGTTDSRYSGELLQDLNEPLDQVVERNPYARVVSAEELVKNSGTQMAMEVARYINVPSIEQRKETTEKVINMRKKLTNTNEAWRYVIGDSINQIINQIKLNRRKRGRQGLVLQPYLCLFDVEEYADLVMHEVKALSSESEAFSASSSYLWRRLGMRINSHYIVQKKKKAKVIDKLLNLYGYYSHDYTDEEFKYKSHRECWDAIGRKFPDGPTLDVGVFKWPPMVIKAVGKLLYDIILYDLKINVNMFKTSKEEHLVPAFYTIFRTYGQISKQEVKPHPALVKLYHGADSRELTFEIDQVPMIVPPLPWTSMHQGGYLLTSTKLIRLSEHAQGQQAILDQLPASMFYPVLDALNVLGACAWVINKPMLDTIIEVFNQKGNKDLDIPPPSSECPTPPKLKADMTADEKSSALYKRLQLKQEKAEMHSIWCNELYKLSIANKFRDDVFWFPHNMDFRGRTYPCPPHFNHLGSDVTRSIMLFAKGKPLGERGLDWLKIHLINMTGFKKRCSNAQRLAYANETINDILDSAQQPFTGNKWWQKSDEPWQTLACCREIANAVLSPDPTKYVSHYPVHQDGSCNGLQHYAALGRDKAGAISVNLAPHHVPQDVYSDVAELVEVARAEDAANGNKLAQIMEGFVRRKVIKQTVMTTVYGVTKYGAKHQIIRQLQDIPDFPKDFVWPASTYLTNKTLLCLRKMFTATKEIQDWLTDAAHMITNITMKPVDWITPLGLPVIQPYHKNLKIAKYGIMQTDSYDMLEKPNTLKQKNAFPPNFIHSLDSTHMMLTALYCMQKGITYVSVHDCFWTHGCDVEVMNRICREQFVALHKQPILQDLSVHMLKKFGSRQNLINLNGRIIDKEALVFLDEVLSRVPATGKFNLNAVLKSTYFFS